ncbi:hypothetical protein HDU92_005109 [Lobulomyces angularis]|nr:hypothetical protein HDU92_005109 [Lobulomyces angularis]
MDTKEDISSLNFDDLDGMENNDNKDTVIRFRDSELEDSQHQCDDDDKPEPLHDFNWDNDNDSVSSKSIKKHKNFLKRLPIFVRYLLYAFGGAVLFMTPGIISYLYFVDNKNATFRQFTSTNQWFSIEGKPVLFWSVFLSSSLSLYFGIKYIFKVLPLIFINITNFFFKFIYKRDGAASTWSIINLIIYTWIFIIANPPSFDIMTKIFTSLIVVFGIFLLEKFFLQLFAVHFHKRAYFDRLEKQQFSESVIKNLYKCKTKRSHNSKQLDKTASNFSENFTSSTYSNGNGDAFKSKFKGINSKVVSGLTGVSKGVAALASAKDTTKAGVLKFGDRRKLAKTLFEGLRREDSDLIFLSDFLPYFSSKNDAIEAFKIFDRDNNGDIDRSEMKFCIKEIYKEHESLENSMHQSSQAIDKLDTILKLFCFVVVLFVILGIFNVNTSSFLTVAISLWAGLLFALGGSIKNLFESMIFLFITHPYDVGDKVEIEGEEFFVKEFWLNTTVFIAINGTEIYSPNFILASMNKIRNIRRSGPTNERKKKNEKEKD